MVDISHIGDSNRENNKEGKSHCWCDVDVRMRYSRFIRSFARFALLASMVKLKRAYLLSLFMAKVLCFFERFFLNFPEQTA